MHTIRSATVEDADALATLCLMVQQLHVARRPDVFAAVDHVTLSDWFRSRLTEKETRSWLAEETGTAVGYAYATFNERPANPFTHHLRWLEIVQLGVRPDHRRSGIARALVDAAIAEADTRGLRDIRIRAWSFNDDAQRTFTRLGFVPRTMEYGMHRSRQLSPDTSRTIPMP